MTRRTITLTDIADRRIPDDIEGVRWPDGTVECRFNIGSEDYLERFRASGHRDPGTGTVLDGSPVECDRCADKCG